MDKHLPDPILTELIRLTGKVSRGCYDNARQIFELTKAEQYPERVSETAGDGLMILFQDPYPTRHAHNAVTTGLAIQEDTERINQKLASRTQPVTVNIGINSGSASVGSTRFEGITGTRWTYTASGPMTNVATRIGSLARDGEILVSEETARRIGDTFSLESIGPYTLKNVRKPVEVFRVGGRRIKGKAVIRVRGEKAVKRVRDS